MPLLSYITLHSKPRQTRTTVHQQITKIENVSMDKQFPVTTSFIVLQSKSTLIP